MFVLVLLTEEMGQMQTTPLSLMTDHFFFSDVRERAHNLSTDVRKGKFRVFCTSKRPSFNVGWLPEGTFNPTTLLQVKDIRGRANNLSVEVQKGRWQIFVLKYPNFLMSTVLQSHKTANSNRNETQNRSANFLRPSQLTKVSRQLEPLWAVPHPSSPSEGALDAAFPDVRICCCASTYRRFHRGVHKRTCCDKGSAWTHAATVAQKTQHSSREEANTSIVLRLRGAQDVIEL
ncbi:uncharacterized protein LOC130683964 [Manis pentadactyla]|uniref:uncharacterized protein LOC130683964 n=1 Tax=Manis pentadactyla TaxID=143292 RepID=UPI00255CEE1F|nr:uncharacterized protein LOC130683964 [Manis pentadactyla]